MHIFFACYYSCIYARETGQTRKGWIQLQFENEGPVHFQPTGL